MIRDVGGGYVALQGPGGPYWTIQPFGSSWLGPFVVHEDATRFVIGAGRGGGPRCQQRSRFGGYGVLADEFLADPADRSGVVFPAVPADPLEFGAGFPVFVQVERAYPGPWLGDLVWRVADLLAGCGVEVTTRRPRLYPYQYGACVVTWDMPPTAEGHAGWAPTAKFALPPDAYAGEWDARQVYAMALADIGTTAAIIVHEILHGFGEGHTTTPGDVMFLAVPSARVSDASRARVRSRTAAYANRGGR